MVDMPTDDGHYISHRLHLRFSQEEHVDMKQFRISGVDTIDKARRDLWLDEVRARWNTFAQLNAIPHVYFIVHVTQTDSQYARCGLADVTALLDELSRQRSAIKAVVTAIMARSDRMCRDNSDDQRLVDYHQGCIGMGTNLLADLEAL